MVKVRLDNLTENKHPINQMSLNALKKIEYLEDPPNPRFQYSLQLMMWALETGEISDTSPGSQIKATLEKMLYQWDQRKALRYLLGTFQDDPEIMYPLPEKNQSPVDLAYALLENLQSSMAETMPGFM